MTPRRRRQEGLIREALYVFLAVAVVMAVLLDGLAIFTAQQGARDDASDAGRAAQTAYVNSGSLDTARAAAVDHVQADDAEVVGFSVSAAPGGAAKAFTVTVNRHAETYVFKYLRYLPGLEDWVEDVQDPTITRTTE